MTTQTINLTDYDVYDYLYQIGSPVSSDVYDYDEFEHYIWENMDDEFNEWLNDEYGSPANLLCDMLNTKDHTGPTFGLGTATVNDWYFDKLLEFEDYVLNNANKYGIYFILKEDEEGE